MSAVDEPESPSARVRVDGQSRVLLPRAIRDATGVESGDELIMFADERGRIVLATRDAVKAELRANFVAAKAAEQDPGEDSTARVRRWRDEDVLAEDRRVRRSSR